MSDHRPTGPLRSWSPGAIILLIVGLALVVFGALFLEDGTQNIVLVLALITIVVSVILSRQSRHDR